MNNILANRHPELVSEWSEKNYPITPYDITYGSKKKMWWKGSCGHEWQSSVKSRSDGERCPFCAGRRVLVGFNDLATLYPILASEWSIKNEIMPSMVTKGSHKKVWWKCKRGHEWYALISTRSAGSGCPFCTGSIVLPGFNDLATKCHEIAEEWSTRNNLLSPNKITDKSTLNVWWKCKECGYEWKAVVASRVKGLKCPACTEKYVVLGYNDLTTTDEYILNDWDYDLNKSILPKQLTRHSARSVWWKCKYGHSWKENVYSHIMRRDNCTVCKKNYYSVFPKLAVCYYAYQFGEKVILHSNEVIGLPIDVYIEDAKVCIDFSENNKLVKKYLCEKRGIKYFCVQMNKNDNEYNFLVSIRNMFASFFLFISSDINEDIYRIRESFDRVRQNNY